MADIRKLIEFYFSDANYRRDTFLRCAAENDAEGFVPISILLTFNKLKSLTTDEAVVAAAVKDSTEVILSEDETRIRRKDSLPSDDNSKGRTLYAKGFPTDNEKVTVEYVTDAFSVFGKVLMVRFRKDPATKTFKGSCFVEFSNDIEMKNAVEKTNADPENVKISEDGFKLACVLPLAEWLERKEAKRKLVKEKKTDKGGKGPTKRAREGDAADEEDSKVAKTEKKVEFTPGLILKVTNIPTGATLYELKDLFKTKGEIKFVDFESGESLAYIRMANTEAATTVVAAIREGLKTQEDGVSLEGTLLEGDEELAYWTKISSQAKKTNSKKGMLIISMLLNVLM
jgi:lupus La protein